MAWFSSNNNHQGPSQNILGMVTSSGPIFAIVNQDIHLSREVAIDCNAWPLYKDSKVKVEIVTMAQRRRNPNPN